jgi:hypothetical protein
MVNDTGHMFISNETEHYATVASLRTWRVEWVVHETGREEVGFPLGSQSFRPRSSKLLILFKWHPDNVRLSLEVKSNDSLQRIHKESRHTG